jgi:hypothetical protein
MEVLLQIARIDRAIDANRGALCRLEVVNLLSVESWHRAWERHPTLRQREAALFNRRGELQEIQDSTHCPRGRNCRGRGKGC